MSSSDSDGLVRDFLTRNLQRADEDRVQPAAKASVVRSFMITQGRTTSKATGVGFETLLSATTLGQSRSTKLLFERAEIMELLSAQTLSVAEVAVSLSVPLGTAMVLCGDMVADELLEAHHASSNVSEDVPLIKRLIQGVRAL